MICRCFILLLFLSQHLLADTSSSSRRQAYSQVISITGKVKSLRTSFDKRKEALKKNVDALRGLRDKYRAEDDKANKEIAALASEKINAIDEYRKGLYCSKCDRSKSQIKRETKETFIEHLKRVQGKQIAKDEAFIQQKTQEYDDKIKNLKERQEKGTKRRWESYNKRRQSLLAEYNKLQEMIRQHSNLKAELSQAKADYRSAATVGDRDFFEKQQLRAQILHSQFETKKQRLVTDLQRGSTSALNELQNLAAEYQLRAGDIQQDCKNKINKRKAERQREIDKLNSLGSDNFSGSAYNAGEQINVPSFTPPNMQQYQALVQKITSAKKLARDLSNQAKKLAGQAGQKLKDYAARLKNGLYDQQDFDKWQQLSGKKRVWKAYNYLKKFKSTYDMVDSNLQKGSVSGIVDNVSKSLFGGLKDKIIKKVSDALPKGDRIFYDAFVVEDRGITPYHQIKALPGYFKDTIKYRLGLLDDKPTLPVENYLERNVWSQFNDWFSNDGEDY